MKQKEKKRHPKCILKEVLKKIMEGSKSLISDSFKSIFFWFPEEKFSSLTWGQV